MHRAGIFPISAQYASDVWRVLLLVGGAWSQYAYFPTEGVWRMSNQSYIFERRHFLKELGVVIVSSLAGCASFNGPQTTTDQSARIAIILENVDDIEREYEVTVNWGETNRSQFTGTLQPAETDSEMIATTGSAPESAEFRISAANSTQSGTWNPTDCPDYRVVGVIETGNPSFDATCQA